MATSVLRTPTFRPTTLTTTTTAATTNSNHKFFLRVSFAHRQTPFSKRWRIFHHSPHPTPSTHRLPLKLLPFASSGEAAETTAEVEAEAAENYQAEELEPELEETSDGSVGIEDPVSESGVTDAKEPASIIIASLKSYREALASNDESKVAEIEGFLKSIEDEKNNLEQNVATLSEELSYEKDRVIRISADFDNFRKRTERERLSLVTNAQGEVVETLLSVLDSFERAKSQIKVNTEGEEKINNSYQSIYKQFMEILGSLGVVPIETVGKPFDPLLHEAIMREDSTEFEEGIIIEEYRKGFRLGDRLLRPAMVKVSAGPGPAKPETVEPPEQLEGQDAAAETSQEATAESESANE